MSTLAELAVASTVGVTSLILDGRSLDRDVANSLTDASVVRAIDSTPTLTATVEDADRKILNSKILVSGTLLRLPPFTFELVQVAKSGSALTLTFEDEGTVALRNLVRPMKAAVGSMTHVTFARRLVQDVRWITFHTPNVHEPMLKQELMSGMVSTNDPASAAEPVWDTLGRMADDRGWRRFIRGPGELWYVSDEWLFSQVELYTITPDSPGVDGIDFDFDVGKPAAQMTAVVRAARWAVPPGSVVRVNDIGPASGKWLVTEIDRSIFSTTMSVTLSQPQPVLPEPVEEVSADTTSSSADSAVAKAAASASAFGSTSSVPTGNDFANMALTQRGKPYQYGVEVSLTDINPKSFDCSELVQWALAGLHVTIPDGSAAQLAHCQKHKTTIAIDKAEHIRGALLFIQTEASKVGGSRGHQIDAEAPAVHHVAISLGDGHTIEARSESYGTGEFSANGRGWTHAALVPGLRY